MRLCSYRQNVLPNFITKVIYLIMLIHFFQQCQAKIILLTRNISYTCNFNMSLIQEILRHAQLAIIIMFLT